MSARRIAVLNAGMVTSVGLTAPASCAAIRAKVTNPSPTQFIDASGEPVMAHQVALEQPWRGLTRLARMASLAVEEALAGIEARDHASIPLLLCVAEMGRPGRLDGLDYELLRRIQECHGARFGEGSGVITAGKISAALALEHAAALIDQQGVERVVIAATDSLLSWPALKHYEHGSRLLTAKNSNGFMPGEGAAALLVGRSAGSSGMCIAGLGFGHEPAGIDTEQPLRGDGLADAMRAALLQAGIASNEIDYRIGDMSGDQYYFKEASLALSRTLRHRNEQLDLWHPAESIGETGAVAGLVCVAVAQAAALKRYAPGRRAMLLLANDAGERAALVATAG